MFGDEEPIDVAEADGRHVVLVGGTVLALLLEERPTLTIRGLLTYKPMRAFVTVDMGAVPHVYNGADVMAPGIVEADPAITVGDLVWIRDERNRQPLAVGEALMPGPEMAASRKGKSVRTLLHVGDPVWKLDEG